MRKLASALVLLRWRRVLATAGHRFLGNIRLRQSRSGDNAHKTVPLFVTPYYTAGNGCNGTGPAGRALRCRKLRQCQESSSGKICYFSPDAFVYAKSAGSERRAATKSPRHPEASNASARMVSMTPARKIVD